MSRARSLRLDDQRVIIRRTIDTSIGSIQQKIAISLDLCKHCTLVTGDDIKEYQVYGSR